MIFYFLKRIGYFNHIKQNEKNKISSLKIYVKKYVKKDFFFRFNE